jgi:hypothetical protein
MTDVGVMSQFPSSIEAHRDEAHPIRKLLVCAELVEGAEAKQRQRATAATSFCGKMMEDA